MVEIMGLSSWWTVPKPAAVPGEPRALEINALQRQTTQHAARRMLERGMGRSAREAAPSVLRVANAFAAADSMFELAAKAANARARRIDPVNWAGLTGRCCGRSLRARRRAAGR